MTGMHTDESGRQWLTGDGSYGFHAEIDGEDLVVRSVIATFRAPFQDDADLGRTASGIRLRENPRLLGCALPVPVTPLTLGSPLPASLPFGLRVAVYCHSSRMRLEVKLIDIGPPRPPHAHAAIDLTVEAFRAIAPHRSLWVGRILVDYRILRGAMFVKTPRETTAAPVLTAAPQ